MIPVYDHNARRRIANSVRYTEAMARDQPRDQFRRGNSPAGVMAIAAADIEHDQIGECLRAEANTFSAAASPISGDSFQVWNPLSRIWNGSRVWIEPVAMTEAGLSWAIVNAWSSTLARGTAGAAIATNANGNLTSVSHTDGHGPTIISAFNPGAEVAAGAKVWAALVWTGTASRWEIITPAAGGGGGGAVTVQLTWVAMLSSTLAVGATGIATPFTQVGSLFAAGPSNTVLLTETASWMFTLAGYVDNASTGSGPVEFLLQYNEGGGWLDLFKISANAYANSSGLGPDYASGQIGTALNENTQLRVQVKNLSTRSVLYNVTLSAIAQGNLGA